MKTGMVLTIFLLFASVSFAGTKEDLEQVQRNLIELQRQFWDLNKELQSSNSSVRDTVSQVQKSNDDMRQSQAALNSKLETVLNQLQALNEKLDETNQRIQQINTAPVPRANVVPMPGGSVPAGGAIQEPEGADGNFVDEGDGEEMAPVTTAPAATVGEQQLLQSATSQYSQGRFEQALRGFQDLLDQYPGSRLADDAQYMIGECYYGMKEYVDAVAEYDKVIRTFPDSDKVPGARLKKAFSLNALGKKGQAVIELQQIVQRYPSTKEGQIARQRLGEMGLD